MRVGIEQLCSPGQAIAAGFQQAADLGLDGLTLRCRSLAELESFRQRSYTDEVRRLADSHALPIHALAIDALRLGYIPQPTREDISTWVRRLVLALMIGQSLDGELLVIPVRGRFDQEDNSAVVNSLWPFVEEGTELAARYRMRIALDWQTGEQFLSELPQSWSHGDWLGLRMDPARIAGIGIDALLLLQDIGPERLIDVSLTNLPRDQEETPAKWQYMKVCSDFFNLARRAGYDGWVTLEADTSPLLGGVQLTWDIRRRLAAVCRETAASRPAADTAAMPAATTEERGGRA
ncbi:MAG: hypothetical protein BIFFINMI_00616 [Phycisphaerae bacterium]|nr:hypothetical protein [Phycisphaerae bacterium]